ncbi:acyl carrier protein [Roseovarius sp. D22-M7]|uniref:acyl carrier protein n=1 Tax=Roseovarius sp. D22-M7 TaxID=3127116 RepID=UPI00300FCC5D
MSDISNRIRRLVAAILHVDEAHVVPEASFINDLAAESLDRVEIAMALETEFGIEVKDNDFDKIRTVGEAEVFIKNAI